MLRRGDDTLLLSHSFQVTCGRRGVDFADEAGFAKVMAAFTERKPEWDELIDMLLNSSDFDSPAAVHSIEFIVVGRRSFFGRAFRSEGAVKIAYPSADYHDGAVVETIVHELAHIVCPVGRKWNGRRDIHGPHFRRVAHQVAKYAGLLGILQPSQISTEIGRATHLNQNAVAIAQQRTVAKFRVGDIVRWTHAGGKWAGEYTGRVIRVNRKTYSVEEITRDDIRSEFLNKWRLAKGSKNVTLA